MHIIYLGSVSGKEEAGQLSGASAAGNNMQWNVLTELFKYKDVSINAFTLLSVASFPIERRIMIKKKRKEIGEGVFVTQVPFINIPVIKQLTQSLSLYWNARRAVQAESIVFSYNLYMQEGGVLVKLKKKFGLQTVALLADLPIDDDYQRKGLGKYLYHYFFSVSRRNITKCDHIIALNKQAVKEFAPEADFIVIEGGIPVSECVTEKRLPVMEKNIVYTGALTEYSGICQLMEAMKYMDSRIVLEIYGDGRLREYVYECEKKCRRIRYRGNIPNDQIKKIQRKAWLLVNPRPINDVIARVTFPSKIFEYMVSGRPVLSTKQTGFTKEYLDHLFVVNSDEPEAIAKKVNEIAQLKDEELDEWGIRARKFIMENKTWKQQTKKIYKFLKQIEKGEDVEKY